MKDTEEHQKRIDFGYILLALAALLVVQTLWQESTRIATVSYSEFQDLLAEDRFASIRVSENRIRGELKQPTPEGHEAIETIRVDPTFASELARYDAEFEGAIESDWLAQALSWIVPIAIFVGIWLFFIRRMAERSGMGGLMSVGQSKAKVYVQKDTEVTFDDVAGVDEAGHRAAGGDQPAGNPGSGAAACRALRPAGAG